MSGPLSAGITVVHITSERGWRGGERQVFLLMRELVPLGISQTLVAPAGSPLAGRAARAGFTMTPLHPKATLHPANLLILRRCLKTGPPPILHAHSSPALTLAAVARRLGKIRGIVYTRRTAFRVRRARKYRTAADVYVAVSATAERCLLDAGTPVQRLRCILDAVDPEHVRLTSASGVIDSVTSAGPTVLSVGHLSPEKGHRVLLEAWPSILERVPEARLLIAGEGPEWSDLLGMIHALDLASSVRLLGFREPIGDLLVNADVFVMPSLEEGLGSAALEAMQMSLPVVASRAGGLTEAVVDGRTGLLVPPGEPGPLAEAVVRLLKNRDERARMGEAARLRARAVFSGERMAADYLRIYRELAEVDRGDLS
ncbi:MAG: glycosyltransferase family 4 protein [Acidobacteria bacterium]|jgi:L-malate glycosyltransferase|nr:glycosyltransferase family 4 protein [Acidobacteriota bacterium]